MKEIEESVTLIRARGRNSITSLSGQLDKTTTQTSQPLGLTAARLITVRCFGGDDGAVKFLYRSGVGTQQLGVGASTKNFAASRTAAGMDREQDERETTGEYFPNILKDVVARMWADHVSHVPIGMSQFLIYVPIGRSHQ